jgi:hypothetical protein
MKNPAVIESRNSNDDLDTNTGLPRKLGWTVAIWAMIVLQFMIVSLQAFLITSTIDQGRRIARIEGKLGISAEASQGIHYAFSWDGVMNGSNRFMSKEHPEL